MENFSRTSPEMEGNYKRALTHYGDEDPTKDGTQERDRVFPTAFITARCFAEQTNVPHARELYNAFIEKMDIAKEVSELKPIDTPHFMELRYLSSEKIIREALKAGEIGQVIELASGFTPHSINLLMSESGIKRYIENDFPVNSKIKQEVVNNFIGGIPVMFIPGNILDDETWEKFEEQLVDTPAVIFCEGLMMYLSREDQIVLLDKIKKILKKRGGFFMHEDILKYHPELKQNPRFASITSQIKSASGNSALDEVFTQEGIRKFYEEQGFFVERVDEDVPLSIDIYPEHARENAKELLEAGFKMWKLSLPQ